MFGPEDFLKNFPDYMIATFDDREYVERDISLTTYGPPSSYSAAKLLDLNMKGAGIFFSVERFPGGKRKKELCTGINSWFCESDDKTIAEQLALYAKSPLTPTFLVRSKKSIHAYWLAVDGTIENFLKIQQGLIAYFGSDPALKDCTRVLRIPGYCHQKTREPFLIEMVHAAEELKYTEEQMMKSFPVPVASAIPVPTTIVKPVIQLSYSSSNSFWEVLTHLSNKEVLTRLSGQSMVNGEIYTFRRRIGNSEYIDVNSAPADCWLDNDGFIGSGKGAAPTWVQWLGFYGHSKGAIAQWAKENLADLIPAEVLMSASSQNGYAAAVPKSEPKVIIASSLQECEVAIDKEFASDPSPFTWGTPKLDEMFPIIENGHYILLFGQNGSGKTTFALHMAMENAKKMSNVCFLSLEMSKIQLAKRYVRDRGGVTKKQYQIRDFDKSITQRFLPELKNITFAGIDAGETYTVQTIEKLIKQVGAKMLFIDNLNKVRGSGRGELEITQSVSQEILNLTRQCKIPVVVIHHANKPPMERPMKKKKDDDDKPKEEKIKMRGMSGMRGTEKTADDADIILEVSRKTLDPNADPCPYSYGEEKKINATTAMAVYKDREFDVRGKTEIYYKNGKFYDNWDLLLDLEAQVIAKETELKDIAIDFGGEVQ